MDSLSNIIDIIQKCLNLAHGSNFLGEREAAQAMAQRLITKYQIDDLQLKAMSKAGNSYVTQDFVSIKTNQTMNSILLDTIAKHNFCRVLRGNGYCIVYGYDDDIQIVISMYSILSLHMQSEHDEKIESATSNSRSDARQWSKSFYIGYCSGVDERIRQARQSTINTIISHDKSVAIYIKDKQHAVEEYFQSQAYDLRPGPNHEVNMLSSGYIAGHASGRNSDIGQTRIEQ